MDTAPAGNAALKNSIIDAIRRRGPIPFSDFMSVALYDPQHGYYRTCDAALDYETSPQVHPVFGATLARQLAELWRHLDRPARFEVFEDGAGDCRLAASIVAAAARDDPDFAASLDYSVHDIDADRLTRRLDCLGDTGAELRVQDDWPATVEGCILTNELLDALPVHRVRVENGALVELHCGLDGDRFVDVALPSSEAVAAYFEALGFLPGEGCEAEVNLAAVDWLARAARTLRRGYLLTLDYGYDAAALYAPWRKRGTLLTFHRHTANDDPYVRVGAQDITASVDFTTLQRVGAAAGLRTLGLTSQAEFLAALGIGAPLFERPAPDGLEAYYALRRAIVTLTDQEGLGRISVLVQGRDVPDRPLTGRQGRTRG